jgi:uncharacterized protein (DUF433 family)
MVSQHLAVFDPAVTPATSELIARVDGVMGGRPVIRGTRITVSSVKGRVSGGDSLDDLMIEYPEVSREAFEAALAYDDRSIGDDPARNGRWREM